MNNSPSLFDVPAVDLSIEQIRELDLDGVVSKADPPLLGWFVFPIRQRRLELEKSNRRDESELLRLLEVVVELGMDEDNSRRPFTPKGWLRDGTRTALVDDFTDEHFSSIRRVRDAVKNAELRARLSDVLWQRRQRDVEDAKAAVMAYMEVVAASANESWFQRHQRIKRAFQIAASIYQGVPQPFTAVENTILEHVRAPEANATYYAERLMRILLQTQRTDEEKREFADRARQGGERAMNEGDALRGRAYFEMSAKWFDLLGDSEQSKNARILAAETLVANALSQSQRIAKAGVLAGALHALRNAGASSERIAQVRRDLDVAQRESIADMGHIEVPFDVTEMATQARNSARGLLFAECMTKLTRKFRIPAVADLRAEVEALIDQYPLRMMISSRRVDARGRVTGVRDGLTTEPERREEAIVAEMRDGAQRYWLMAVLGVIEPYRKQMLIEHAPSLDDFTQLIYDRPFVPAGREEFFARGLLAGYYGDFLESSHILVPQVENSLRALLERSGKIIYGQTSRGVQDFVHLNDVMADPGLTSILGNDLVFDLTGLLVDRFGANFRNELSHGLLEPSASRGVHAIYLWWMTLYLTLNLGFTRDESG